jgi:tetratricopeptide (TPR) repeat protein
MIYLSLLFIALWYLKRSISISFGIALFIISILPFSNLFLLVPGVIGDRFLLVPSLGWCIVVVTLLFKIAKVNTYTTSLKLMQMPKGLKYSLTFILVVYSIITYARTFQWKDDLTLFRHDIGYVDKSAQAHNLLALHLMQHSETEPNAATNTEIIKEALFHFQKATEIYPRFFNATYDLARVYSALNMPDSSIEAFKRTLAIDTSFSDVYLNIANLFFKQNKYPEAIPYFKHMIEVRPNDYISYDNLSFIYFNLNEFDKALEINRQASGQAPRNPYPLINIGRTFVSMNQRDSAIVYFNKALLLEPGNGAAMSLLKEMDERK